MELRRIDSLPPYVFATIRELTLELRRAGEDVVDLGFGNPDLPSPEVAVAKLQEAAAKTRAPSALPTSTAARPTPPPAPRTKRVSPSFRPARISRAKSPVPCAAEPMRS